MTAVNSKPVTAISLTAARLSIAAVIAYQAILIALIFIRPDLDPSWHTISEWAIGRYGWIMVLAFLLSALSYGSLLVAIKPQVRGVLGKAGLGLLLICAIGTVGVGVFITDPMPLTPEKGLSTSGALHVVFGTSAVILLPFAALLVNLSVALKNPAWVSSRRPLLWTAGVPLLGLVGAMVHLLVFLSYMVWLVTLATQVIRLGHRSV